MFYNFVFAVFYERTFRCSLFIVGSPLSLSIIIVSFLDFIYTTEAVYFFFLYITATSGCKQLANMLSILVQGCHLGFQVVNWDPFERPVLL